MAEGRRPGEQASGMGVEREARRAEFERSALPHLHSLHNVAMKLERRRQEAEDLVQETLLRAYRFYDHYEAGTNIRAWLFKIMRNLFINRYRREQREPREIDFGGIEESLEAILERDAAAKSPGATPEEVLVGGSLDEEVERALADLPDEYRLVLLLSAMEGLSYKEIAEVLACPIGTVMSRLHRARRMMQAGLMDYARERGLVAVGGGGTSVVRLAEARDSRRRK